MTKFLELSRELKAEGFLPIRSRGSHHTFRNESLETSITLPMQPGGRSIHPGLVKEIRCQIKRAKRGLRRWQTNK